MKTPTNITNNDWILLKNKYKNLDEILQKIEDNYPVQYLIGNVDFYGYPIEVNENVLIPRFETETLVEKVISRLKNKNNISLLEVGTGSGCISIALQKEIPNLEITAIDISKKAILVAKKNAKINRCKINFIVKDMTKIDLLNKYDVLISNPPYINPTDEIDPKTKYEPQNAIYAPKEGLAFYYDLLEIAKKSLNDKHLIAFEIGEEQGTILKHLAKEYFPNDHITVEKDLANKNRYLFITND